MKVKICGITNLEDALIACREGADALGFVFYPKSPRFIEHEKAYEIVKKLPPFVKRVALFVNEKAENINSIMKDCKMDIAQIHFEPESPFYDKLECEYIKVARIKHKDEVEALSGSDEYVLVDAFVDGYGGEGKRIEKEWFRGVDCSKMILAGGLNESNLSEIKEFSFYGVDVSSGVELYKGKKDPQKIKNFIRLVKNL